MTVDGYFELEDASHERHEFLDGQVWAMSGGTDAHDALSTAIAAEFRSALRGSECMARGSNLRIKSLATGLYTYADALIVCSPRFEDDKRTTLLNPRVVVEVVSESSEAYDRGEKFAHYRAIESVGDYVLISTTAPRVEVYTREADAWTLRLYREGESLRVPGAGIRVSVQSLYEGIALDPPRAHAAQLRRE
jgi:Uma2 family endonuclease